MQMFHEKRFLLTYVFPFAARLVGISLNFLSPLRWVWTEF